MIDHLLRPIKDSLLRPAVETLAGRIYPNSITAGAFLAGLASVASVLVRDPGAAFGFWILNRVLDGLDGAVARRAGIQSDTGGYLDILTDFFIYAAIPIAAFHASADPASWLSLAVLLALFYLNAASWMYLSAILEKRDRGAASTGERTSVTMPGGPIEGGETIVFYSLFLLFPRFLVPLFQIMAALVALTIVIRVLWSVRVLGTHPVPGRRG